MEDYRINLRAGDITWTGSTSTDWDVATNWTPEVVPTAALDVLIPSVPTGGRFPTINAGTNAECHDLNVESGATLIVNGNLELKSTAK